MKKLGVLSIAAVTLCGGLSAEVPFQSVADAAVITQDKELRAQAEKSVQQIVDAVSDVILLTTKKLAEKSNQADRERLKEIVTHLEQLLSTYHEVLEHGDPSVLSPEAQQELGQQLQIFALECAPLLTVISDPKLLQVGDEVEKAIRGELFKALQAIVILIKNNL